MNTKTHLLEFCTVTHIHVVLLTRGDVAFTFSPLRLVSSYWLSGFLFLVMQLISDFIRVSVRWNGPTLARGARCEAAVSAGYINSHWYKTYIGLTYFARPFARDHNTAPANQSASQDCWLVINQRLESADLRHRLKQQIIKTNRLHFKTRPPPKAGPSNNFVASPKFSGNLSFPLVSARETMDHPTKERSMLLVETKIRRGRENTRLALHTV